MATLPMTAPPAPAAQAGMSARSARGLDLVNLFLADVRDGLGPYLAIYLIAVRGPAHGWNEVTVGLVISIAGIVGLIAQAPAGALIDASRNKRLVLGIAALAVTVASVSLPFIGGFATVTASQSLAALAAAVFAPGLAAITLGLTGPKLFARRIGRNEAFNHAGNAVSAAIAGLLACRYGPAVVFWLMGALALASVASLCVIDGREIDDQVARGIDGADAEEPAPSLKAVLIGNRPLLIFAILGLVFHLANAAMLPSVGQLLAKTVGADKATSLMAACIVAAQLVMVPVSILVGRKTDAWGTKPLFLAAFAVLAMRGILYPLSDNPWWLLGVQALDGVGAGIFGALFPVIVADLTRGSGHYNVALGAVATTQGIGGAVSATLAGTIIVTGGYSLAFLTLGGIAAIGGALYWWLMPETRISARQR